jgi:hypothetical protein
MDGHASPSLQLAPPAAPADTAGDTGPLPPSGLPEDFEALVTYLLPNAIAPLTPSIP